jgi:hypothetical protein
MPTKSSLKSQKSPAESLIPPRPTLVHPSSILRAPDDEARRLEHRRFVDDLKKLARVIK